MKRSNSNKKNTAKNNPIPISIEKIKESIRKRFEINTPEENQTIYDPEINLPRGVAVDVRDVNYFSEEGDKILSDINITVPVQDCFVILGLSGSGKSTLLKLMSGIIEPKVGSIKILGKNINSALFTGDIQSFMNKHIGFVFQEGGLLNNLNVFENIALPLLYHAKMSKSSVENLTNDIIDQFNLNNVRDKHPGRLSYGQKKFVGLARAFALNPEILFLDEPTTNIDMDSADKVIEMIRTYVILGGTVISVTSDMIFANSVASMLGIIERGRIIEYGTPTRVKLSKNHSTKKVIKNIYKEADLADEIVKLIS